MEIDLPPVPTYLPTYVGCFRKRSVRKIIDNKKDSIEGRPFGIRLTSKEDFVNYIQWELYALDAVNTLTAVESCETG